MPDQTVLGGVERRLFERYRDGAPDTAVWNPLIDSLVQHRSVRAYKPDPLAPGTLETLVAAAQSAATSSNLQAWSVIAVQDAGRKARLSDLAAGQKHIRAAPLFLVWLADLSRAARLGQRADHRLEGLPFLETFLVAVIDAALAAQNAVAAAESLGLGTVYLGAIRNRPVEVAAELGLPPGTMAVFGLCVGHPDPDAPASVKPRLPQPVVLHREQYGVTDEPGEIAQYDASLRAFQQEQAMTPQGWSELLMNRLGTIKALSGRDRLVEALRTLGFGLQ